MPGSRACAASSDWTMRRQRIRRSQMPSMLRRAPSLAHAHEKRLASQTNQPRPPRQELQGSGAPPSRGCAGLGHAALAASARGFVRHLESLAPRARNPDDVRRAPRGRARPHRARTARVCEKASAAGLSARPAVSARAQNTALTSTVSQSGFLGSSRCRTGHRDELGIRFDGRAGAYVNLQNGS